MKSNEVKSLELQVKLLEDGLGKTAGLYKAVMFGLSSVFTAVAVIITILTLGSWNKMSEVETNVVDRFRDAKNDINERLIYSQELSNLRHKYDSALLMHALETQNQQIQDYRGKYELLAQQTDSTVRSTLKGLGFAKFEIIRNGDTLRNKRKCTIELPEGQSVSLSDFRICNTGNVVARKFGIRILFEKNENVQIEANDWRSDIGDISDDNIEWTQLQWDGDMFGTGYDLRPTAIFVLNGVIVKCVSDKAVEGKIFNVRCRIIYSHESGWSEVELPLEVRIVKKL